MDDLVKYCTRANWEFQICLRIFRTGKIGYKETQIISWDFKYQTAHTTVKLFRNRLGWKLSAMVRCNYANKNQ